MSLKEMIEGISQAIDRALEDVDIGGSETNDLWLPIAVYEEELGGDLREKVVICSECFDDIYKELVFIQEKLEDLCDIRNW